MKTTEADLDQLTGYLKNQVGWVELAKVRKAIPTKHAHSMKVDAIRHIGLLDRDGDNVKLTADGRDYAGGDGAKRAEVIRKSLRADQLYFATLEWMHYQGKTSPTKTDVANYWHDNHAAEIGGAKGDALTDSTVFFMRMVGLSELGKFVPAGVGREHTISRWTMTGSRNSLRASSRQRKRSPVPRLGSQTHHLHWLRRRRRPQAISPWAPGSMSTSKSISPPTPSRRR